MAVADSVLDEVPAPGRGEVGDHALAAPVFEQGKVSASTLLAGVHQHGAWIDWRAR